MVLAAVRLAYTSVARFAGEARRWLFRMDSIGVMPLPPATASTCRGASDSARPKAPSGGIASTRSPGRNCWCSQLEKAPPATRRTPTRSGSPGAAHSE